MKGRQLISAQKSESMAFTSGLEPKDGFSLEVGGIILVGVTFTCSNLTLIVLGSTGEKDQLMLSPFLYMLALCSISLIWSMINNSAANKDY